ncbi:MAG: alanine racemase [candidate division KSB1 bacterium]|nr:alanine racemase [candidate division KSB1 bacterium]
MNEGTNKLFSHHLCIERPTLILNKPRAVDNIHRMVQKAARSQVHFRPHFKTHQSAQIGEWFRQLGVEAITVSSVEMASYFAQHGWRDITIAFPVNILEIESINKLAAEIQLHLLVESAEVVAFLDRNLQTEVGIWIKIDVGYHRTGIWWEQFDEAIGLARQINRSKKMVFRGLLTHSGHAYRARSADEVKAIYHDIVHKLQQLKQKFIEQGLVATQISIGDTPSCSVVDDFSGVDEIRPGNFVFYDVMQLNIGSCTEQDIAVVVACPVVAKHRERNEIMIYGGAVHLSKEFIVDHNGNKIFGYVAPLHERGWGAMIPNTYVSALSQEHGIIKTHTEFFDQVKIGDILAILPVHSCLTVPLLRSYLTLEGETIPTMHSAPLSQLT